MTAAVRSGDKLVIDLAETVQAQQGLEALLASRLPTVNKHDKPLGPALGGPAPPGVGGLLAMGPI